MVLTKTIRVLPALLLALIGLVVTGLLLAGSTLTRVEAASTPTDIRFIDQANLPLEGTIRVLCYTAPTAGSPVADILVTTGADGRPTTSLPLDCNYLAALQQRQQQPSGKPTHGPAYWVYATSWDPGATTPVTATGDIVIRDDRPLVLFNVVAALAWEPAADSSYLTELYQGLGDASAYLYDLTNGQMAFGPVAIHTGGRNWEQADMRFLASNDYHPAAYPGGIISATRRYTSETTFSSTTYIPATTFLGRYWDGLSASNALTGTWDQSSGYRTLVHEWGHYALFFYDEYLNFSGAPSNCTAPRAILAAEPSDASMMYYQYETSELWSVDIHGEPASCKNTQQHQFHGRDDWETLAMWYHIQGITPPLPFNMPTSAITGPTPGLAGDLFGREPGYDIYLPLVARDSSLPAPSEILEPAIDVHLQDSVVPTETIPSQVYLLAGSAATPTRILHQGQVIRGVLPGNTDYLGQIRLLGVGADDRMRIFADRYRSGGIPGQSYFFPASGDPDPLPTDGLAVQALENPWQANLDLAYGPTGSHVTEMQVILTSLSHALTSSDPPVAQLCATDAAIGCDPTWRQPMTRVVTAPFETWAATFTPLPGHSEFPLDRVVRVQAPGVGEIIRWAEDVGGVGGAGRDAHAPLRDGLLMVDTTSPTLEPGGCNRVLIMPAANADAVSHSLGQTIQAEPLTGIVGVPLDIDIMLGAAGSCPKPAADDHTLPVPVTLTFFYDQSLLDGLGIAETQLRLLHFIRSPGQGIWVDAQFASLNPDLNAISSGPVTTDGIYAIGWVP